VSGRDPGARRGFTLLEVMVAMAIMAFMMASLMSLEGSSAINGARVYNLTTATELASAVALDLEEEFRTDGFPTNSVEGRSCDLPRGFRHFDCEYDLLALDVGIDNVEGLGSEAIEAVTNSPIMAGLCGGGPGGMGAAGPAADAASLIQDMGVNTAALGALQALLDPDFAQICGVNLARMCQNIPMIASFIPKIIEQAANSTRKLQVRISWAEAGRASRTLEIETFLVSVPEAEDDKAGGAP